jgi:hypothetical protein
MKATVRPIEQPATIEQLIYNLRSAKDKEERAHDMRLAAEEALLSHPDIAASLKDEGTVTVGAVKVSTGYTRKWDESQLSTLRSQVADEYWPFRTKWDEDRRASRLVEERFPDLWAMLRPALTLTPRKPSIQLTDKE